METDVLLFINIFPYFGYGIQPVLQLYFCYREWNCFDFALIPVNFSAPVMFLWCCLSHHSYQPSAQQAGSKAWAFN